MTLSQFVEAGVLEGYRRHDLESFETGLIDAEREKLELAELGVTPPSERIPLLDRDIPFELWHISFRYYLTVWRMV